MKNKTKGRKSDQQMAMGHCSSAVMAMPDISLTTPITSTPTPPLLQDSLPSSAWLSQAQDLSSLHPHPRLCPPALTTHMLRCEQAVVSGRVTCTNVARALHPSGPYPLHGKSIHLLNTKPLKTSSYSTNGPLLIFAIIHKLTKTHSSKIAFRWGILPGFHFLTQGIC